MIRPLIENKQLLKIPSDKATIDDLYIIGDLRDTFLHTPFCVGMACNMIGFNKQILIMNDGKNGTIIINPVILYQKGMYKTSERCACFIGDPPIECTRYQSIKIEYYNEQFQKRIKVFKDLDAQIIQHQIDHFNGIII